MWLRFLLVFLRDNRTFLHLLMGVKLDRAEDWRRKEGAAPYITEMGYSQGLLRRILYSFFCPDEDLSWI